MAAKSNEADPCPPDFAQPWLVSDVILVVEDQKFHVHRSTLAMWSPLFEKMFTSEFQEKNLNEIPLPGKKAREIKELLLKIYLTVSETNKNVYFLVKLADEYQMEVISQRCEEFLVEKVSRRSKTRCLDYVEFAKTYKLEKLLKTIIDKAQKLRLGDFKSHAMYDKIEPHIYKQIVEGMIKRLELDRISSSDSD